MALLVRLCQLWHRPRCRSRTGLEAANPHTRCDPGGSRDAGGQRCSSCAGDLDTSFGTGGKVVTSFGSSYDSAYAVALQPDGKIVAAGESDNGSNADFALVRYTAAGSLDSGFGTGGKVTTPFGSGYDVARGVVLQSDGKIVAAGYSSNGANDDFALARYNADGSLDPGFGTGGKVTTAIGSSYDRAYAVALQSDGKIVAAGFSFNGTNDDFALVRYNADGSLDSGFGTGGKVTTGIGSNTDFAYAVALQSDGKIVAAGYTDGGAIYDFALARYNADGSLDPSFGTGGKVTTPFGSFSDVAYSVALQSDGKIVAAGYSSNGANADFALVRYTAAGSLDPSFGTGGKVRTAIGSSTDSASAVALQSDGKIVAAGSSDNPDTDFALARYTADGSLDPSFGTGGKVTTAIGSLNDFAHAVVLQSDGKIVAAGESGNGAGDFALARYLAAGPKTLTVAKAGTGAGTVSSSPAGIDCGSTCSHDFTDGSSITLTATAQAGSTFAGWSGDCSGAGTCTLTMSANHSAAATFESDKTLTISKAGSGSGSVSSSPSGIDCGATCSHAFAHGTSVTLTATPAAGSTFAGWSSDCSGTGTCTLTMSANHSATATFESDKTLTISKTGSGSGSVSSSPSGIACGSTCSHAFTHGTSVTLTASAQSGSKFAGWSGDCSGTGTCSLIMDANHSATASFQAQCIVPNVRGKTLAAAKTALTKAHCSLGTVKKATSKKKEGTVIAQNQPPGKKLAPGSKVNVVLSRGKK